MSRPGLVVERTSIVLAPPARVYAFLIDTANFRTVDPALVDHTPGGRLVAGMRGTMRHRRSGLMARTTFEVTLLEPDGRIVVDIAGAGYTMREDVTLRETADGSTTMTVIDTVQGTSLPGRVFVALSKRPLRRDLEARATRLGAALASSAG